MHQARLGAVVGQHDGVLIQSPAWGLRQRTTGSLTENRPEKTQAARGASGRLRASFARPAPSIGRKRAREMVDAMLAGTIARLGAWF